MANMSAGCKQICNHVAEPARRHDFHGFHSEGVQARAAKLNCMLMRSWP
jgi:hypothetical protein